jgi:hypothetical protein
LIVVRGDDRDQHAPTNDVQAEDKGSHTNNGSPFLATEPVAEPRCRPKFG